MTHNAENEALAEAAALVDRWAALLDEAKMADPHWVLDRSVVMLYACLAELRHALTPGAEPYQSDTEWHPSQPRSAR